MSLNVLIVSNLETESFIENALTLGISRLYGPQTYQSIKLNDLKADDLQAVDILFGLLLVPASVANEAQIVNLSQLSTWKKATKILCHIPTVLSSIHILTAMDKVLTADTTQYKTLKSTLGAQRCQQVPNWLQLGLLDELKLLKNTRKETEPATAVVATAATISNTNSSSLALPQVKIGLFFHHATFAKNNIFSYQQFKKSCYHLLSSLVQQAQVQYHICLIGLDPGDVAVARDIIYFSNTMLSVNSTNTTIEILGSQFNPMDTDSAHQITSSLDCALTFHPVGAALCVLHHIPFQFVYLPSTLMNARAVSGDLLYKLTTASPVDSFGMPSSLPANLNLSVLSSSSLSNPPRADSFECLIHILKQVQKQRHGSQGGSGSVVPDILDEQALANMNELVAQNIGQVVQANEEQIQALKTGELSLHDLLKQQQQLENSRTLNLLARLICFVITGSLTSDYFYGLYDALQQPNFILPSTVTFIYRDALKRGKLTPTLSPDDALLLPGLQNVPVTAAINLSSFPQGNFAGLHRSGWAYVTQALTLLQKEYGIVTDLYCDRTFGWASDLLTFKQSIPYTQDWIGFIHHGRDEKYSSYSIDQLFNNPAFLKSIPACKAFVVLSSYLKSVLLSLFQQHQITQPYPQVWVLTHPTELVPDTSQFSMETFLANPQRGVYQVGSWYRESYSIYSLPLDEFTNTLNLKKFHLKAAHSDRYFRPRHFFKVLETSLMEEEQRVLEREEQVLCRDQGQIEIGKDQEMLESSSISSFLCRDDDFMLCRTAQTVPSSSTSQPQLQPSQHKSNSASEPITLNNVYSTGALHLLKQYDASVVVVPTVSNVMFDVILKSNVLFLHLTDASAVNTLIEAIVRCTPVLVNPLPAVVEMLGVNYPFYYSRGLNEAASKLGDIGQIQKTYDYLRQLDKSRFSIETFMSQFQDHVLGLGSQYQV